MSAEEFENGELICSLAVRKGKGNGKSDVKGSGQECPLYTRRRENARDSCESRALCFYLKIVV